MDTDKGSDHTPEDNRRGRYWLCTSRNMGMKSF